MRPGQCAFSRIHTPYTPNYAYFRGVKNRCLIVRVACAIVLLLMVVLLPHHHHDGGGVACWVIEICDTDGHANDEHTAHDHHTCQPSQGCSVDFTPHHAPTVRPAEAVWPTLWLWLGGCMALLLPLLFPTNTTPIYNKGCIPLLAGCAGRSLRRRGPPCFMA